MRRFCVFLFLSFCLLAVPAFADTPQQAADADTPQQAAETAANTDSKCTDLGDFYWEIGDVNGPLAHGQVGSKFEADTFMRLDSASKMIFGTYALQKLGDKPLTPALVNLFRMTAGYSHGGHGGLACLPFNTLSTCAKAVFKGGPHAEDAGKFAYGGAHSVALGLALGLGDMDGKQLEAELAKYLGDDVHIKLASLVFAGGMKSTPQDYAVLLRKILAGKLRMHDALGKYAVCAGMSGCPAGTVIDSPSPIAWHYSLLHWVEADKDGDGAFSSAGAEGFYPWISADKKYYGILARQKFGLRSGIKSAYCGIQIRHAFLNALSEK